MGQSESHEAPQQTTPSPSSTTPPPSNASSSPLPPSSTPSFSSCPPPTPFYSSAKPLSPPSTSPPSTLSLCGRRRGGGQASHRTEQELAIERLDFERRQLEAAEAQKTRDFRGKINTALKITIGELKPSNPFIVVLIDGDNYLVKCLPLLSLATC